MIKKKKGSKPCVGKNLCGAIKFKIDKSGFRKDTDDYFRLYLFQYKKQISPFIIVDGGTIYIGTHTADLLSVNKDAFVFHTWVGKYRSDVFVYTIDELREWVSKQPDKSFYLSKLKGEV